MIEETKGRKGLSSRNSQWRIWSLWSSEMSSLWKNYCLGLNEGKSISVDKMEYFFSSVIRELDGATIEFPQELFIKQSRIFLVQPSTQDRFSFNQGDSEFQLDGTELLRRISSAGKSGEKFAIASYGDLAVILDKSFTSTEIWIVHGGVAVQPFEAVFCGEKDSRYNTISSLLLNKANLQKRSEVIRIHIEEGGSHPIDLLLEDMRPAAYEDFFKFSYTAKEGKETRSVTRTGEIRSNIAYKTELDRWCFPILTPTEASKVYRFFLTNDWAKDPCWADGDKITIPMKSMKSPLEPSQKFTSPIFTSKYAQDEVLNKKKASGEKKKKRRFFNVYMLWGSLAIIVLLLAVIKKDHMQEYYSEFNTNLNATRTLKELFCSEYNLEAKQETEI